MGLGDGLGLKPSRSEDLSDVTEEEKRKHSQQLADFLASNEPHRPIKPGRSEDLGVLLSEVPPDACQREIERFKELQANGEVLVTEGGTVNDDSYVVTPYYDGLNAVDKSLHHETGTGFILQSEKEGVSFAIKPDTAKLGRTSSKTNPATNEWQPAPSEEIPELNTKVRRSDP